MCSWECVELFCVCVGRVAGLQRFAQGRVDRDTGQAVHPKDKASLAGVRPHISCAIAHGKLYMGQTLYGSNHLRMAHGKPFRNQTLYRSSHTSKTQGKIYMDQTKYGSSHTPKVQVESYEGQTIYGSSHTLKICSMGQVI